MCATPLMLHDGRNPDSRALSGLYALLYYDLREEHFWAIYLTLLQLDVPKVPCRQIYLLISPLIEAYL